MTWLERLKTIEEVPVILQTTSPSEDIRQLRLVKFTDKGLNLKDAHDVVQRLELRDLQKDNRILCYECKHLKGYVNFWRCGNYKLAEVGIKESHAGLPNDMVDLLQRCNGFNQSIKESEL